MPKPITYYCTKSTDQPHLQQLQALLALKPKQTKVELAHLALALYSHPNCFLPFHSRLIEESLYLEKLSSQGLLDLACALLEEVRNP